MSTGLSHHDAFFRKFLGDIAIARDFLEIHLPKNFRDKCDFNTLAMESGSFIDDDLRGHCSDPTAWSANPAVQGGEERLSGYERLKREWPECVRCVEASPFPHSGW